MSDFERKLLAQDDVLAANAKMVSEAQNSIKGMKILFINKDSTKYLRGRLLGI